MKSAGKLFRAAVEANKPLQCLGAVNAYSALLAKQAGAKSLYLSGSGVATASHGLPDLGITNLNDVCDDIRRITSIMSDVPLLVDVDTGFGSALGIRRCVQSLIKSGAGAMQIEDQVAEKRCGHRPGKQVVPVDEMIDRLRTADMARHEYDKDFVIMARTDCYATEGMDGLLARCEQYISKGKADMLFPEALTKLEEYKTLADHMKKQKLHAPILANITEFGKTPLFNAHDLHKHGVSIVLYPLSAHRAMAKAAQIVYKSIIENGSQAKVINLMQTRDELYEALDYYKYERILDELFEQK
ncbi:carboxyphosphonoenolpyruvate phosphonomutase [Reticulomyxa filosa]|uniref:Carboxyphosphonoenolpyruvate phosphonomutase n=1 Tax=Reticulomyxa filosa TaxID=46433 RepID=X6MW92_RETFI|nr:carboxyphosphonoenolpyruvate phosphonomutase [Reticulomyxa filosa]|eukprot:ETO18273.1 carboxyphosphonoenolpyruvate phosphonomutase [Reticulomyxa filosa]